MNWRNNNNNNNKQAGAELCQAQVKLSLPSQWGMLTEDKINFQFEITITKKRIYVFFNLKIIKISSIYKMKLETF
jgi:hypothetical protein